MTDGTGFKQLPEILSSYITRRDSFRAGGVFRVFEGTSVSQLREFTGLVDANAAMVADCLPDLTIAQYEALSELVSSRLNYMRNRMAND